MPKTTGIELKIPAIYRRSALNLMMFGYVTGVRATLHTVSMRDAMFMFMESFDLEDEDFNVASGLTTYNRMQKEFLNQNTELS